MYFKTENKDQIIKFLLNIPKTDLEDLFSKKNLKIFIPII